MSFDPHGELAHAGAVRVRNALTDAELGALVEALSPDERSVPGIRLAGQPAISGMLAADGAIGRVVSGVVRQGHRPVRAILFDKALGNNWSLGWHQDRVIAVKARGSHPDFGPWSTKDGIPHVAPPFDLLSRMITARVHLDPVDDDNAPLLIALGSHRQRHAVADVEGVVARSGVTTCLAEAGDVWLYATPILHASAAAERPRRRRVLQVDFSPDELPSDLEWFGL